jgi:formylglycine-generating enzyme required for sulfatase activity
MVCIEGGTWVRADEPRLELRVPTYWLDAMEVTVAAYSACVTAGACTPPDAFVGCNWGVSGREADPINCLDWDQADRYCAWVDKRIPDEAEWEWAARGRDEGRTYPWGEAAPIARAP